MPSLVRSPFNQGGTYQPDAFDSIEVGNRDAALRAMQMGMGLAQNNAMAQLAMARLRSDDTHYAQDRQDRIGNQQALFGYLGKRDAIGDQRWKFENDPSAGNPFLKSQVSLNDAQSQLALQQLKNLGAGANTSPAEGPSGAVMPVGTTGADGQPVFENNEESALYQSLKGQGQSPAAAYSGVLGNRDQRYTEEEKGLETDAASDLDRFSERDNAMTGWDPTQQAKSSVEDKLSKLQEMLQMKLHMSAAGAKAKVDALVKGHTKHSLNSGWTDSILRDRGIQY